MIFPNISSYLFIFESLMLTYKSHYNITPPYLRELINTFLVILHNNMDITRGIPVIENNRIIISMSHST